MTLPVASHVLHLSDTQLTLQVTVPDGAVQAWQADIGAAALARRCFRRELPTPLEIEQAIDVVEDVVTRWPRATQADAVLQCADAGWQPWAALGDGATLSRDTVETWFQRLASASLGQPMAMQGLPAGAEAAARLLIVRELMHHLGYGALEWQGAAAQAADATSRSSVETAAGPAAQGEP
jgi:hypothetical protein